MDEEIVVLVSEGPPALYGIDCPICREPLELGISLDDLLVKRGVRPGDEVRGDCGDLYPLPDPFPDKRPDSN